MASTESHVYLITGANRGIGKALVATFLSRPNTTVIAAVRDPSSPSTNSLSKLPTGHSSKLITVKLDSTVEKDSLNAVQTLQSEHGITQIGTVIANAGIGTHYGPILGATASQVQEHVVVNGIGPLLLFQAVYPLLKKASSHPKFVLIGSPNGSIGGMENYSYYPTYAYGASKAMAHFLIRKIHFEHEDVVAFAVDPGFVQTDMGNAGAKFVGMAEAPITLDDATAFIVAQVDGSTREKSSGHFPSLAGGEVTW